MSEEIGRSCFGPVAPYYDLLMRSVPYQRWADYVDNLFEARPNPPVDLLDLCCGTGEFGLAMARRGYTVTGLDLSEPMVEVASAKVRREGIPMDLVVGDARALPFAQCFDAVVSVFDSLNYILPEEGLTQVFVSVYEALRPGGVFGFDMNTLVALEEELFTQSRTSPDEPLRYRWISRWDPETRLSTIRMHFEWQEGDECLEFDEVHVQRGHSDEEIRASLRAAGLEPVAAYTAYTMHKLTSYASRAFYLAVRHS